MAWQSATVSADEAGPAPRLRPIIITAAARKQRTVREPMRHLVPFSLSPDRVAELSAILFASLREKNGVTRRRKGKMMFAKVQLLQNLLHRDALPSDDQIISALAVSREAAECNAGSR